jgi:hypothetical protein
MPPDMEASPLAQWRPGDDVDPEQAKPWLEQYLFGWQLTSWLLPSQDASGIVESSRRGLILRLCKRNWMNWPCQ